MEQNQLHDRKEKWEAIVRERQAELDKLDAEARLEANNALNDFKAEADAAGDWLEADWDQFVARVDKWWQSLELTGHEARENLTSDNNE